MLIKKAARMLNVIKLSSKTRPGTKMESETAWEKPCAVCFFGASKEKAYSKQSGGNIRLKKMFL